MVPGKPGGKLTLAEFALVNGDLKRKADKRIEELISLPPRVNDAFWSRCSEANDNEPWKAGSCEEIDTDGFYVRR